MPAVAQAGQRHVPVNPCSHEGAHEGPRGYAHALKDGATLVVLDEHGDINRSGSGHQGLYYGDTRHVSPLALSIQDAAPVLLYAATRRDNSAYASHLLSPAFEVDGKLIDAGAVHLERTVTVSSARYYEQLQLTSYALQGLPVSVIYELEADFRDMFEVRGIERTTRGRVGDPVWNASSVAWEYVAVDGKEYCTAVFLMLASSIGLRLDAFGHRVIFEQPALPEDLEEVEIHDLAVGDRTVDLVIYRRGEKVAVAVARNEGQLQVQIVP